MLSFYELIALGCPANAVGWRLTTIRRWNPVLANKIERGLADEIFPFAPAA